MSPFTRIFLIVRVALAYKCVDTIQYYSSMHLRDPCITDALSVYVTFRVAIENASASQVHPISAILKQVYGAGSLAAL